MNWYKSFVHWLELHQGTCFYHKYFGVDCPGCGMQRSFIELLKGNFYESFIDYPALLPLLGMFIFLLLHLKFKFSNGAKILIYWFIINVLIIVISYVVKMV
jgi:hypothetical protein